MEFLKKLFGKKSKAPEAIVKAGRPDPMQFAIKPSPEKVTEEANVKGDVYAALPDALRATGAFRVDAVGSIVAELQRHETPFRPISSYPFKKGATFALPDGTLTTLDGCLATKAADIDAPKLIDRVAGELTGRIQRSYDLKRWDALGIARVKITPGQPLACSKVQRIRKIHPIDSVPEIPLAGCSAKFCSCLYSPLIEGVDYQATSRTRRRDTSEG